MSLILTDRRKYCLGLGWENDEVEIDITSTTTMFDCYKKVIENLCDRSSTFSGRDAKWLDECDSSQYVTAGVYTKQLYESHID